MYVCTQFSNQSVTTHIIGESQNQALVIMFTQFRSLSETILFLCLLPSSSIVNRLYRSGLNSKLSNEQCPDQSAHEKGPFPGLLHQFIHQCLARVSDQFLDQSLTYKTYEWCLESWSALSFVYSTMRYVPNCTPSEFRSRTRAGGFCYTSKYFANDARGTDRLRPRLVARRLGFPSPLLRWVLLLELRCSPSSSSLWSCLEWAQRPALDAVATPEQADPLWHSSGLR